MTMKRAKHWENAVDEVILAGREMTEQDLAVSFCAAEIDNIEHRLAENARDLARRCDMYADYIEAGRAATAPSGYSAIGDIERDAVRREAKLESFFTLVRATHGKGVLEAVRKAVSASRKGGV